MTSRIFTETDSKQIHSLGMDLKKVESEIQDFKKGVSYTKLSRPCTPDDGIIILPEGRFKKLTQNHSNVTLDGRTMKFVPASGAASRMFKTLQAAFDACKENQPLDHEKSSAVTQFMDNLELFGFDIDLTPPGRKKPDANDAENLLSTLLTEKGLGYANLPKGLIPFHRYEGYCRTAFEEHLVEAADYILDKRKTARIHFTVTEEYLDLVQEHINAIMSRYARQGTGFRITYSTQKKSTDTIAVDLNNEPFRKGDGSLLFRPGGHGVLIENLNALNGDVIFIKNIDNVVPDHLKETTSLYKKLLCGYLIELQAQIFSYLEILEIEHLDESLQNEVYEFAIEKLAIHAPYNFNSRSPAERKTWLFDKLNRPLRICGMVKNEGEPGGGPFWVEQKNSSQTLQIVEKTQVNFADPEQKRIWNSSTHFNPVDLVCAVRDYRGRQFDLRKYIDPNACFISLKSKNGRELKAMEVPGLWNGAMAYWNTVFVEVPGITFNPVKSVFDLLRQEHQPEMSAPVKVDLVKTVSTDINVDVQHG